MTRKEYLNELADCLKSLTQEDRNDAVNYYTDYFADADDDAKVMEVLGTPQQLAQTIISTIAGLPQTVQGQNKTDSNREKNSESDGTIEIDADKVKGLHLSLNSADVKFIQDSKFFITYSSFEKNTVHWSLDQMGNLHIVTLKSKCEDKPAFVFFGINIGHMHSDSTNPGTITVHLPENFKLDSLYLQLGAGNCKAKESHISVDSLRIKCGMGNVELSDITSKVQDIDCGLGNIKLSGVLESKCYVKCGMGNIKLNFKGNPDDYGVKCSVGLGNFKFNDVKMKGITSYNSDNKDKLFVVNCGMGNVKILIA